MNIIKLKVFGLAGLVVVVVEIQTMVMGRDKTWF